MISGVVATRGVAYTPRPVAFNDAFTTGSIAGGSLNTLTVADSTGFVSGGKIIIAVGGEAGAGLPGSKGVGGTWPALSYANAAAMNADNSKPANTFCWLLDTGVVYQYRTGVWTINTDNGYYSAEAIPKALVTTATISGNTLTLATPATVATTNARVYFDNLAIWNAATALGGNHVSFDLPEGTFAASDCLVLQLVDNCRIRGVGQGTPGEPGVTTIMWPDGMFPATGYDIIGLHDDGNCVQDLTVLGNWRTNGFCLAQVTETTLPGTRFPGGVFYGIGTDGLTNPPSQNGKFKHITAIDVSQRAIMFQYCENGWAYSCTGILTEEDMQYTQWQFFLSNTVGGGTIDCVMDSEYGCAAFESFNSDNCQHIRPRTRNGIIAANTASGALIDAVIVFEDGVESLGVSPNDPLVNLNTNLANVTETYPDFLADGFYVRNLSMTQEGYYNDDNDTLTGLVVNSHNVNVTVEGGSYTAPDYAWPSTKYGAWGFINDEADNCNVSNFTVVGKCRIDVGNITNYGTGGSTVNCTADVFQYPPLLSGWNASDKAVGITLATSNLSAERTVAVDGNYKSVRGETGHGSAGNYHFEIIASTALSAETACGLANSSMVLSTSDYGGIDNNSIAVYDDGTGTSSTVYLNDVDVVHLDFPIPAGTVVVFEKRGTLLFIGKTTGNWNGSGAANPATGAGGIDISGMSGTLYPMFQTLAQGGAATLNTGGPAFARTPTAGFSDWG